MPDAPEVKNEEHGQPLYSQSLGRKERSLYLDNGKKAADKRVNLRGEIDANFPVCNFFRHVQNATYANARNSENDHGELVGLREIEGSSFHDTYRINKDVHEKISVQRNLPDFPTHLRMRSFEVQDAPV